MLSDEKEYTDARKHPAVKAIPQTIPRISDLFGDKVKDTDLAMKMEWFKAMKGKPEDAYSRFDVAAFFDRDDSAGLCGAEVRCWPQAGLGRPRYEGHERSEAARFVKRHNRKGWEMDLA